MDYFRYIFYLGIVYIVFSLIWFFIAQGIKFLLRAGKEEQPWQGYLLKAIQYYFVASLTLLKAAEFITSKPELASHAIYFYLVGGMVLYLYLYGKFERSKQFAGLRAGISVLRGGQMKPINIEAKTKYEPHLIGIVIIFYLVALQFPQLVQNKINTWFLFNINDFYDTVLIKWILGVIGFFFMLGMVLKGITATGELIQQIIGLVTGKPYVKKKPKNPFENMGNFGPFQGGKNPFQQNPTAEKEEETVDLDDEYVDFEYVDEDDPKDDKK